MAHGACYGSLHRMYGLGFDQYRFLNADTKSDGFAIQFRNVLNKLPIPILKNTHHNADSIVYSIVSSKLRF